MINYKTDIYSWSREGIVRLLKDAPQRRMTVGELKRKVNAYRNMDRFQDLMRWLENSRTENGEDIIIITRKVVDQQNRLIGGTVIFMNDLPINSRSEINNIRSTPRPGQVRFKEFCDANGINWIQYADNIPLMDKYADWCIAKAKNEVRGIDDES